MSARGAAPAGGGQSAYLPDFCRPPAVLTLVLVAVLLAVVLALARHAARGEFWIELARTSALNDEVLTDRPSSFATAVTR